MASPLSDEVEQRVRELFEKVEAYEAFDPKSPTQPFELALYEPGQGILVRGEALATLDRLQGELAGPALTAAGPSPEAVRGWLLTACWDARNADSDQALSALRARFDQEVREWAVVAPLDIHMRGDSLKVGPCQISSSVPARYVNEVNAEEIEKFLPRSVIETRLEAVDDRSARLIAAERFAEARAVLVLANGTVRPRGLGWHLFGLADGLLGLGSQHSEILVVDRWMAGPRLTGPFGAVADVLSKVDVDRTDWERRTLSAWRWFARVAETAWLSEILVVCMVALECLFVEGRRERAKGQQIASRLGRLVQMESFSPEDQAQWVRALYSKRNDAVHEGRDYLDDVEMRRLIDITHSAVLWAAWHLLRSHTRAGAPCTSFSEALEPHDG